MSKPVPAKYRVTTPYGVRGRRWSSGKHEGVDFACPTGTSVFAAYPGKVVAIGRYAWGPAFGNHCCLVEMVAKRPSDRKARKYYGIYGHMSADAVKVGQVVKAGQLLGKSGAEGNVTGPHLHFEVQGARFWQRGSGIDPQFFLDYKPVAHA